MSDTLEPFAIIIHPWDPIERLGKSDIDNSKPFFFLDSEEFKGGELFEKVREIRCKVDPEAPIVVVGAERDYPKIHEEANQIAGAGAIYFERPSEFNIDQFADKLRTELVRIHEGFEPFSSEGFKPGSLSSAEREFYVQAPFGLSEESLKVLRRRLDIDGPNPKKED